MISTTNVTNALGNMTRRNQLVLDGKVSAVMATGALVVDAGRATLLCVAVGDHRYASGERVRVMQSDDRKFVVVGRATRGQAIRTGVVPALPAPPSSSKSSQSVHVALQRLVARQNQALKRCRVTAVRADGTLEVLARRGGGLARAATNERFTAGQRVYALRTDRGTWVVMGSTR